MVRNQARSKRQPSGARFKQQKVRRQHESGREPAFTRVADAAKKVSLRTIGGNQKVKALEVSQASVLDADGKHHVVDILGVEDNPANRQFVRRNIVTKGAVIDTEKGLARVTSRPGQTGAVNAVLLE